jgi:zinc protease
LEDKATVELYLHGDFEYTAENNVQLDALKTALEIKILERLREKESGVYSPEVGLSVSKYPSSHYYFNISFSCATANVEKLIAAALDEVKHIREAGATVDDISKFKSEEKRQHELSLRNNNYWLSYLSIRSKYGDDLGQLLGNLQRLDLVTVESTKSNAQKYLTEDNYIRLVLMPEKK